jgi:hypothetical protein
MQLRTGALVHRFVIAAVRRAISVVAALPTVALAAFAQPDETVPYCSQLKELNNLEMSRGRFAPVLGPIQSGNYRETKLPLTG